jgi:hypothetical protein
MFPDRRYGQSCSHTKHENRQMADETTAEAAHQPGRIDATEAHNSLQIGVRHRPIEQ